MNGEDLSVLLRTREEFSNYPSSSRGSLDLAAITGPSVVLASGRWSQVGLAKNEAPQPLLGLRKQARLCGERLLTFCDAKTLSQAV